MKNAFNNKLRCTTLLTAVLVLSGIQISAIAADAIGSGPYPALMESDPGLPTHTVYRPQALSELRDTKLPIVAFGNGGCMNAGSMYRNFLTEVASHGFLVIAIGPIGFDLSVPATRPTNNGERPARAAGEAANEGSRFPTNPAQLKEAIDWALAENSRVGSQYFGKLDTNHIALMGQSCGGLQAMDAALSDERVDTLVLLNSGVIGGGNQMREFKITKQRLKDLRGPIGYFTGGEADGATANTKDDLNYVEAPLFYATMEVGHMATYAQPNGGPFAAGPVAWLKWQLKDDADAKAMFVGENCGLCQDSQWTVVERRRLM